ncbi:MAG TPA: HupE/UreJ family protein [Candidatus Limnocylindria bacterium]|nr:HupE/UreJ family protein [Candidatus Limnocylindria bacterium]
MRDSRRHPLVNWRLVWLGALLLCLAARPARAHTASTAWLTLSVSNTTVTGQWEISLRDLDDALGLDANDDGLLTWGELRARQAEVATYAFSRLGLRVDGVLLAARVLEHRVSERGGNACAVLRFDATAAGPIRDLALDYRLFFDRDPLHRGLVSQTVVNARPAKAGRLGEANTAILSPEHPSVTFHLEADRPTTSLGTFFREGIHHIWTGYDHLLFLLALLLPAVLWRGADGWRPQASFRLSLRHVLQVVTAFTVAHSITLALAAFDLVRLPSRLVESTIAASIAVAAIANLRPRGTRDPEATSGSGLATVARFAARPWVMPFAFGLIHGFGFAGALSELDLRRGALAVPLVGFNLGVEAGQLACVAVFLPLAFALRGSRFYRLGALPVASVGILLLAGGWLVERACDLKFLPF